MQFVDETTGEIIEAQPAAALSITGLTEYAIAKLQLDAARLTMDEHARTVLSQDERYIALRDRALALQAKTADVEDALALAFDPAVRQNLGSGIVLDVGAVRICWRKPAKRWTMKTKAEDIANQDPELAKRLGISSKVDKPSAPVITIHADKLPRV